MQREWTFGKVPDTGGKKDFHQHGKNPFKLRHIQGVKSMTRTKCQSSNKGTHEVRCLCIERCRQQCKQQTKQDCQLNLGMVSFLHLIQHKPMKKSRRPENGKISSNKQESNCRNDWNENFHNGNGFDRKNFEHGEYNERNHVVNHCCSNNLKESM